MSYIDNNGLLYFWQKLKVLFNGKVDTETGKGLSTNDFTNDLKTKLDGVATEANKYVHPSYTTKSSGLYKITVDSTGHVSNTATVAKADITALGIPSSDTTYGVATSSVNGLMSGTDKAKLDAFGTASTYATKSDVTSAVNAAGHLKRQIVSSLPTSDIDTNTIYMILKATAETNNAYDEYMYINSAWEKIGSTETNISSITNAEIDTILAE